MTGPSARARRSWRRCPALLALAALLASAGAAAQSAGAASPNARNAQTVTGQVGQRQRRDQVVGVVPTARIDSRIQNRVISRLQTRLDENYVGVQSGATVIENAGERSRRTGVRR
ncbi:hypothetical protein [Sphingomonas sp. BK345]|uniref:hypothetical protein n=1 Tax=Sphingomonas sp. BK345 TaxID=2586980 RepID=UPI001622EC9C|nr:hypothetical protein [Sphingomonas sp. BK345]MBB3475335.1 hypothetical protein [Sphingomonas sp. BK345]